MHDLARDLGKNVELTIEGADTELDKTVIDQLSDPLMHLIRNSMDHGIEAPAARVERGPPATASIHRRQAGSDTQRQGAIAQLRRNARSLAVGHQCGSAHECGLVDGVCVAGLDIGQFKPVAPLRPPPVYAERVLAWQAAETGTTGALAVDAASLGQRMVYFQANPTAGGRPERAASLAALTGHASARRLFLELLALVVAGSLAWYNVR